jgi:UDP:flavonoid glycosyltransferase YjiC (YdhE family)
VAAYGRVPFIAVGTGFTVPPGSQPRFPNIRPGASAEDRLFQNVAEVQRRRVAPMPPSLPKMVGGDASVVATLPELDVYGQLREAPATGPIGETPPQMPPARAPSIFAYLDAGFPGSPRVLEALAASGMKATAYVRGGAVPAVAGVEQLKSPAVMTEALRDNTLIVHHGGCGTAEQCLLAGRPQFLVPRYDEQQLTARQLQRLGVGVLPEGVNNLAQVASKIAEAAVSSRLRDRSQELAAAANARLPWTSSERVEEACLTLAA